MADLERHRAYLEGEWRAALAAPLSLRKALLVSSLIDAYVDRTFAAAPEADDILQFRAEMAHAEPALGLIFDLCAQRPGGPRLVIEAIAVPLAEYGALSVEDFMVSLYNDHSVQRLTIALPDGGKRNAHDVLAAAIDALA